MEDAEHEPRATLSPPNGTVGPESAEEDAAQGQQAGTCAQL